MHHWYKNYEILTNTRHSQSHATVMTQQHWGGGCWCLGVTGLRVRVCCVSAPYTHKRSTESGDVKLLLLQLLCFSGHTLMCEMEQLYLSQRKVVKIKCDLAKYLPPRKPLPLSSLVQTGGKYCKTERETPAGNTQEKFQRDHGAGGVAQ